MFDFETASVTDRTPVGADDAVAGNENRQRVFVVGAACRPTGFAVAGHFRQLFVAAGFAERNFLQGVPYFSLKIRSFRIKRQVKFFPPAGKIFRQLIGGFGQKRGLFSAFGFFKDKADKGAVAGVNGPFSERGGKTIMLCHRTTSLTFVSLYYLPLFK